MHYLPYPSRFCKRQTADGSRREPLLEMPLPADSRRPASHLRIGPHPAPPARHLLDRGLPRSGPWFPRHLLSAFLTTARNPMKSRTLFQNERIGWHWAALFGLCVAVSTLWAAETNAPAGAVTNAPPATATNPPPSTVTNTPPATATNAPQRTVAAPMTPEQMFEGGTNAYNNWIEFGVGGFFTSGNKAQFQQRNRTSGGSFGGIEDFHCQNTIAKGTTMNVDGRGIFDNDDYKLSLAVDKEKLGYVRFSLTQFRTWSDGDGGFYAPANVYYPQGENALALDRGDISIEAGLTLDKLPQVKFKYDHLYRDGEEGSTSWEIG